MNTPSISNTSQPGAGAAAEKLPAAAAWLDRASPLGDLLLRGWVAYAFWVSGLTKIRAWDSTLYLFEYEYSVPLLPPEIAAYLGTAVELGMPVLLAAGLLGRFAALALFVFNIVAVISYPDLGAAGLEQHKVWGVMLLVCLLHGPANCRSMLGSGGVF
jgi:putative oxidoreductase